VHPQVQGNLDGIEAEDMDHQWPAQCAGKIAIPSITLLTASGVVLAQSAAAADHSTIVNTIEMLLMIRRPASSCRGKKKNTPEMKKLRPRSYRDDRLRSVLDR
jgi:hypothetical protein